MADETPRTPFLDALTARLGQVAVDKAIPAAVGYMEGASPQVAGLSPSEHLAGELSGLGDLPPGDPMAQAYAGHGGYAFLPSGAASYQLVRGDMGALPGVAFYATVRAALIAAGLYAAGERSRWNLLKYSAAGSAAIQLWILWWAATRRPPAQPPAP